MLLIDKISLNNKILISGDINIDLYNLIHDNQLILKMNNILQHYGVSHIIENMRKWNNNHQLIMF